MAARHKTDKREDREAVPVRFDATIHPGRRADDPRWMDRLDVDRVPDSRGRVRALLTVADCVRLLEQGFEIRLRHAHPVRPLDPRLIESDESVRRWLEAGVRGLERAGGGTDRTPGDSGGEDA